MTDIAIIGTGVAGLSAAVTATARNKSILLFGDKAVGGKLNVTHDIKNFLGFYKMDGAEIQKELSEHISGLGISVTEKKITNVYKMGDHFTLLSGQEMFEAKSVILAGGISFGKPLSGESDFLGRGVSYCATCDGMLFKGKSVAVIAYSKAEEKEADFLTEICSEVYYFPQYKEDVSVSPKCRIISGKNFKITGGMKAEKLSYDGGEIDVSCVFILRENIPPAQLISGIEMDGNHIAVDRKMRTNIPGFFAAGDITGTPYQFAKSAGEGNVACLSAVEFLAGSKE